MRYVEVNGVRLSSIGLGCWQFGSREWGYGKDYVENEAGGIVRRALELGITLIDTAEVYGFGTSERVVGQALADRRSEAFVATKVLPVPGTSSFLLLVNNTGNTEDAYTATIMGTSGPVTANLMDPTFTEMGSAYAVDPGSEMGVYWAQAFGRPR